MRVSAAVISIVFTGCLVFGQSASASSPLAFEAASVRPAARQDVTGGNSVRSTGFKASTDPNLIRYANITLRPVLMRAFDVKSFQITGPAWLDSEHYDIVAKLPDGTPRGRVPAMLQNLLTERFKMRVHWDSRKQRVYVLVVGGSGARLKASKEGAESAPGPDDAPLPNSLSFTDGHIEVTGVTLPTFADLLAKFMDSPVRDMTGLQGGFDIILDMSMQDLAGLRATIAAMPSEPLGNEGESHSQSIFGALQKLGLKLEPRAEQVKLLVVDAAQKVPTEN